MVQDGHPPLGWHDTAAYLVLPVVFIVSQYVSMEIMKHPQIDDPAQKNTLLVFKFLSLTIGYFLLSVPPGLTIYWFTNNVLTTAQHVWLRILGGAKPIMDENASDIITPGRPKRSFSQPAKPGERFTQLQEAERRKIMNKAVSSEESRTLDSEGSGGATENKEAYASNLGKQVPESPRPRKSKLSKRKCAV